MKGISPLIAAVFLIVFTVLIAGILATFATSLTREQIATTGDEAKCIGALDLNTLSFDSASDIVSFRLRNTVIRSDLVLEDLSIIIEFDDPSENSVYPWDNASVTGFVDGNIDPSETLFVNVDVSDKTSDPKSLEVVAGNCPRAPASMSFR
ncbi:hypothetical protein ACFLQN_01170 [Candidatus Aenigmatarchaeota archaeon]